MQYTYILCKQKLLFGMQLILINRLIALIKYFPYFKGIFFSKNI